MRIIRIWICRFDCIGGPKATNFHIQLAGFELESEVVVVVVETMNEVTGTGVCWAEEKVDEEEIAFEAEVGSKLSDGLVASLIRNSTHKSARLFFPASSDGTKLVAESNGERDGK